ncbi:metalloregulator ArsR/SmtB family transcription factor [Thalassotalea sp. PLHSN55]|uniref:metalloregulator ArsR/SmtB family transcription factor n=1 Tax=Thalassotalea sp. PLHSN55 TaxID=3435888 RepID=UPI003F874882
MASPTQFFKNLADDTRLKIMLLAYAEQEVCVCELTSALDLSQPKISRHLAQLKTHGLLSGRRSGKWVFYALAADLPKWQREVIVKCFDDNKAFIETEYQQLISQGNRPNRQQQCC